MSDPRHPLVAIFLGSTSDEATMAPCGELLGSFGITFEQHVSSAHRAPERTSTLARRFQDGGGKIIIAAAGMAAHLPGVIASQVTLPVIGVPMAGGTLGGLDALLSIVQMPGGVPVGTVSIGKAGAKNAAILALEILALSDPGYRDRLLAYRASLADS